MISEYSVHGAEKITAKIIQIPQTETYWLTLRIEDKDGQYSEVTIFSKNPENLKFNTDVEIKTF